MMVAKKRQTYGEELANVLTHGAGMCFGLTAIAILCVVAIQNGNPWVIGSFIVYAICMTLSYVTSTIYHACSKEHRKKLLRHFDHAAISCRSCGSPGCGVFRGGWGICQAA